MSNNCRIAFLWLILTVGMILHFNYHVGEIFYGINVVRDDAKGIVPLGAAAIRFVFQILPLCFLTFCLYFNQTVWRRVNFYLSLSYTVANVAHLVGQLQKPDLSQINLLVFVLVASLLLNRSAYDWWQESR
ncbi:MAG: hypothetical protein U5L45_11790 [Saprospiraceae bacterium]|nr:hypothetical protein [Saprospiraceae bacterium]